MHSYLYITKEEIVSSTTELFNIIAICLHLKSKYQESNYKRHDDLSLFLTLIAKGKERGGGG